MSAWKELMLLTLFMLSGLSGVAAADGLPFTKPVDNIPANVYGGNKKVWDGMGLSLGDSLSDVISGI